MRRIIKGEIYTAISSKYPSLKAIDIVGGYNQKVITRDELWKIMLEIKADNTKHLTKEQKNCVEAEKRKRMIKELS